MNIFVLAATVAEACALHCDKHVVKMILEYTQLLYTAHVLRGHPITSTVRVNGETRAPYKPTHAHHPCALWVASCAAHRQWLLSLAFELCARYTHIYKKSHACLAHLESINKHDIPGLPETVDVTEWKRWMRADLGIANSVIDKWTIAIDNVPKPCRFVVLCMDNPSNDAVLAYRQFYAHKAFTKFKMQWGKCDDVPDALAKTFSEYQAQEDEMEPFRIN